MHRFTTLVARATGSRYLESIGGFGLSLFFAAVENPSAMEFTGLLTGATKVQEVSQEARQVPIRIADNSRFQAEDSLLGPACNLMLLATIMVNKILKSSVAFGSSNFFRSKPLQLATKLTPSKHPCAVLTGAASPGSTS